MDLRWAVAVFAGVLLAWATGEANHFLAPLGVAVVPYSLAVVYPALYLDYGTGLAAAVVSALASDAFATHGWGLAPLVFSALHAALHHARRLVLRSGPRGVAAVAAATAACWPLVLTLWHAPEHGAVTAYWIRCAVDTAATCLVAGAAAPPFLALQSALAALLGLSGPSARPPTDP